MLFFQHWHLACCQNPDRDLDSHKRKTFIKQVEKESRSQCNNAAANKTGTGAFSDKISRDVLLSGGRTNRRPAPRSFNKGLRSTVRCTRAIRLHVFISTGCNGCRYVDAV